MEALQSDAEEHVSDSRERRPRERSPTQNIHPFNKEEANRLANARHTPHRVPKVEVISEEDPDAGLPPPGGHLNPSVGDAVFDENLD